jgi:hypothetical protein
VRLDVAAADTLTDPPFAVILQAAVAPLVVISYQRYAVCGGKTVGATDELYAVSVTAQSLSVDTDAVNVPETVTLTSLYDVAPVSVPDARTTYPLFVDPWPLFTARFARSSHDHVAPGEGATTFVAIASEPRNPKCPPKVKSVECVS